MTSEIIYNHWPNEEVRQEACKLNNYISCDTLTLKDECPSDALRACVFVYIRELDLSLYSFYIFIKTIWAVR